MDEKRVLVTGLGGNVAQGIVRNIRATNFNIKIIGTNVEDFSAGNHLCNVFYKVPYAVHENFISTIKKIVVKEQVDLVIPSTDYEVYYLAKFKSEIPCEIVVSDYKTAENYIDKYKTFLHHKKHDLPFAAAFLPSEYDNNFEEIILKPREGRGSRGLLINPKSFKQCTDQEYMVQEFHKGKEITTAFYVNKNNKLHGFITLSRHLENGTTTHCKVETKYNTILEKILLKMIAVNQFRGSANLQSIVTNNGQIVPFEINCRISGTNSIRSNFGFEDVLYTLQEFLYNDQPKKAKVTNGVATRILMDVIYPNQTSFEDLKDNTSKHYIY